MLRLHDHHVEPSLLAKFNKQRGNTEGDEDDGEEDRIHPERCPARMLAQFARAVAHANPCRRRGKATSLLASPLSEHLQGRLSPRSHHCRFQHLNRAGVGIDLDRASEWHRELSVDMADHRAAPGWHAEWPDMLGQDLLERQRFESRSRPAVRAPAEGEAGNLIEDAGQFQLGQHPIDPIHLLVDILQKENTASEVGHVGRSQDRRQ